MLAKPEKIRGSRRVTKAQFHSPLANGWRNSMDEAYTGNRLAHREVRTLPNGCILTAP